MQENFFTHALYQVKQGKTEAFLTAWENFVKALSQTSVSGLIKGTLIQSEANPLVFYSFGSWESLESIKDLQTDKGIKKVLQKMSDLCEKAEPGNYKTIRQVTF